MYPEKSAPTRAKRPAIEREEEKAWIRFYQRVDADPVLATEIVAQLDSDAELRRRHSALYLCSKQSLHAHKARRDRSQRLATSIRWLALGLLLRPLAKLLSAAKLTGRRVSELAVALLPQEGVEPAVARVGHLLVDSDITAAQAAFRTDASAATIPGRACMDDNEADISPRRAAGL